MGLGADWHRHRDGFRRGRQTKRGKMNEGVGNLLHFENEKGKVQVKAFKACQFCLGISSKLKGSHSVAKCRITISNE